MGWSRGGSEIRLRAQVRQVLLEGGRASGVLLADGGRVAGAQVIAAVPCGDCYECNKGWMAVCQNQTSVGYQYDGGFAEYMIVPRQVLKVDGLNKIPDNVGYDEASAAEPFACAINAQELLGIEPGDTVVVFGAGPIGCMHIRIARGVHEAGPVYLVDVNAERLKMSADAVHPEETIDGSQEDVVARRAPHAVAIRAAVCERRAERRRRVRRDDAAVAHDAGNAAHQKNRDRILISSFGCSVSSSSTETSTVLPLTTRLTLMRRSVPRSVKPPASTIACETVVPVSRTYDPGFFTKPEM